jgi:2-keto-4-pentenoate hydratase/2-oxohepta-3-ene-1,7-dioic acid hydratase in catechol pathway
VQTAISLESNIFQPDTYDLKAPIYDPQKLICIGLNYRDHCTEQKVEVPKEPLIFSKFSSAITEPNGVVELSDIVKVDVKNWRHFLVVF